MIRRWIRKWRNRRALYKIARIYIYLFPRDPAALDTLIHAFVELTNEYEAL